ncbi:MAG: hypothetical protein J0I32_20215 [Sphingobacteriales bacterium]|nr:hypothetical protein [Sphingobacteriales bacterium]OJV98833.1 MAG: hypothetical protein BGO52_08680 [Sphingobacteriales bacterium 44-61]
MTGGDKIDLFIAATIKDCRIHKGHLALYMALFHFWKGKNYISPIGLFASEVMKVAKISSNATYHRLIKELHDYGYIKYEPSFYKYSASKVFLSV